MRSRITHNSNRRIGKIDQIVYEFEQEAELQKMLPCLHEVSSGLAYGAAHCSWDPASILRTLW